MAIGVVADVHGNRHALEAVLADARTGERGIDRWWVLGDLVAIGPDPAGTLEVLADLPAAEIIRGNTDRYTLTDDRPPPHADDVLDHPELLPLSALLQRSFAWTTGALASTGWLDWLGRLPLEVRTVLPDGSSVLGVHACPGTDDGPGITPDRDAESLGRDLTDAGADIVVAGHTHVPTDRVVAGIRAVNPGSISNPITEDLRASYAILHADRHGVAVEHRRVAYDRAAFLTTVERSGHPAADYIASFQRGEQVRHTATTVPEPGFAPAIRYMRTDAERHDQRLSWARPDRAFFASGACHILAFRFVRRHADAGFRVVMIRPHDGLPGSHAYATDGVWAFDFNGWVPESTLLHASATECRRRWPAWQFDRIAIDGAVELDDCCRTWEHRLPTDFAGDVLERADRYLDRLLAPGGTDV